MIGKIFYTIVYVLALTGFSYLIAFPFSVIMGIYSKTGIIILTIIVMLMVHAAATDKD